MTLSLRSAGVALGAAVLLSGASASGAMASTTQVSFISGNLIVQAATGTNNMISVSDTGVAGEYRIKELGTGNTLGYTLGGIASLKMISQQEGIVTTSSPVTKVQIWGDDGDDVIVTNALAMVANLQGGSGNDQFLGGAGNSTYNGGSGDDIISGGSGNDLIAGSTGADTIYGNGGNDTIYSIDATADSINGGAGTDVAHIDNIDTITQTESILFT